MVMQETMRDAAVERLSKIISDRHPDGRGGGNGKNAQPRKSIFRVHISLDEGWFSLFLLATVVYTTIWCVQAADWVDHLSVLTLTTLIGLITGVVAAKQQRLPRLAVNLINIDSGYIVFLVVFLLASLLLLLRFNLYESVKRWRRQGLRYADDLGWDVMQAGALISIGILIFSWFLPWGYTNDTASQIWNANANPVVQFEDLWNRAISLSGGGNPSNHGNFRDTLVLSGNPNLNNDVVFTVQSADPNQYLASLNYDTYDGRSWSNGSTYNIPLQTNQAIPNESTVVHSVVQQINFVNPPG